MSVDSIGDFLTIIRNGILVSKSFVLVPYSKLKNSIADILKQEGFIKDVLVENIDNNKYLKIVLKYIDGESVIHEIERVSKPSRRVYQSISNCKPVIGGLGIAILTTNRGIMTDKQAKKYMIGGEVICTVW